MRRRKSAAQRTLYIKNPAAHNLANQISKKTGVTLTEAVIQALEDQVHKASRLNRKAIDVLCARISSLPIRDNRNPDQILGYNKFGIPE